MSLGGTWGCRATPESAALTGFLSGNHHRDGHGDVCVEINLDHVTAQITQGAVGESHFAFGDLMPCCLQCGAAATGL